MKNIDKRSWPLREFVVCREDLWMKSKYSTVVQMTRYMEETTHKNQTQSKTKLKFVVKDSTGQVLEKHLLSMRSNAREYQYHTDSSFIMKRSDTRLMFCREKTKTRFAVTFLTIDEAMEATHILEEFVFTETKQSKAQKVQENLLDSHKGEKNDVHSEIQCAPPSPVCHQTEETPKEALVAPTKQPDKNASADNALKAVVKDPLPSTDLSEMKRLICLYRQTRGKDLPAKLNIFKC
jgi:hypothetical protein